MKLGLNDKVVFISGSSKGIGLAIANAFLLEGARVIINARQEERLKKVNDELEKKYPRQISYIVGDVTSNSIDGIVEAISDRYGKLDIFIANLGNGKAIQDDMLNKSEWERFFEINLFGSVNLLSKLKGLIKQGNNPSVIFVSSVVAKEVTNAPIAYASAKSAVITLSKYLSSLWAKDNIRVNCVLPGNILFEGGRWEELISEDPVGVKSYIDKSVPMKRFGKPGEVADAVIYLASDRASFITGAALTVDGGQLKSI